MRWSPREERAINHYMTENNLRFELQGPSASRSVYFQDKATGDQVTASLDMSLVIYDQDRSERTKERARLRRQELKRSPRGAV